MRVVRSQRKRFRADGAESFPGRYSEPPVQVWGCVWGGGLTLAGFWSSAASNCCFEQLSSVSKKNKKTNKKKSSFNLIIIKSFGQALIKSYQKKKIAASGVFPRFRIPLGNAP